MIEATTIVTKANNRPPTFFIRAPILPVSVACVNLLRHRAAEQYALSGF